MANIVYVAESLDGYIAGPNGELDWLNSIPKPENCDYGWGEFIDRIDAILMGKNTFDVVLSFGEWHYTKPVFVLSNSLKNIPEKLNDKCSLISGSVSEVVSELNNKGYKNIYVDGGKVIQSFLNEGLIDELIITKIPVLLGDGIPLFSNLTKTTNWKLIKSVQYENDLVKCYYKIGK